MRSLKDLDTDALTVALEAADALMEHMAFLPRGGLLLMLLSRFRDDTHEVLGMATARCPGRGQVFRSLDEMTTVELAAVAGAVGTLLEERFTLVMDDPELEKQLREFQARLNEQKMERAQLRASIAS